MSDKLETAESQPEQDSAILLNAQPPVRVLVQTLTHLVPGLDGHTKEAFILNTICQHHWQCDFSYKKFRLNTYNALFGYNNRRCFFLVDYGTSENDDDVPILTYEWTGQSLKPSPRLASDPEIMSKLKTHILFTPKEDAKTRKPYIVREVVRRRIRSQEYLTDNQMKHMREHPEDLEWLKKNLRPRFWHAFVEFCNHNRGPGDAKIEEELSNSERIE